MRRPRRHEVRRPLGDDGVLFFSLGRTIMEIHRTLDHVGDFVAVVHMELAAVLATARDKGQRLALLPQDLHPLAGGGKLGRDLLQLQDIELLHLCSGSRLPRAMDYFVSLRAAKRGSPWRSMNSSTDFFFCCCSLATTSVTSAGVVTGFWSTSRMTSPG